VAGYASITVPAGYAFGLPIGLSFIGRKFGEGALIKLAYAYEQATKLRRKPTYLAMQPFPNGQPAFASGTASGTATSAANAVPPRLEALMDRLSVNPRFRTILRNL
jgi:hypothetical protein